MTANFHVRRATVDDLGNLKALWETMRLPAVELEKRLTEFQIVVGEDGTVAGALGIQIVRPHGWLHSEAYTDMSAADVARPELLKRVQSLAANHGVFRLWLHEQSPFWLQNGFVPATPEALAKLPPQWAAPERQNWHTLQLKDEAAILSLDKEFALFRENEKQRTERALEQARFFKSVIMLIGAIIIFTLLGFATYMLLTRAPRMQ